MSFLPSVNRSGLVAHLCDPCSHPVRDHDLGARDPQLASGRSISLWSMNSTASAAWLKQLPLRADPPDEVVRLYHQALLVVIQGHFVRGVGPRQHAFVLRAEV